MKPDVFQYENPVEYLQAVLDARKSANPNYSLRAFSRHLGFNSPSTISSALTGERRISFNVIRRIAFGLNLSADETRYLERLTDFKNETNPDRKFRILEEIRDLRGDFAYDMRPLDVFRTISDWYHLAILAMTKLKGMTAKPKWIRQRLRGTLTDNQIKIAIDRLERLALIEYEGSTIKLKNGATHFGDQAPDEAIRKFHKQMIEKAFASVDGQGQEERDLRGSTLCIRKDDYQTIRAMIDKFHRSIMRFHQHGGDEIYQMNTQFFALTTDPNKEEATDAHTN